MYVQVYFHKVVRILNLHLIDLIGRGPIGKTLYRPRSLPED
ncbi:MAG: hypothetical protein Q9N34_00010 [Aquificota bacterium]|nr:hypothetical protein [Aquificota bacterium]